MGHCPLAALDLEGSGAQDHEDEAILEIAVVPPAAGQPPSPVKTSEAVTQDALFGAAE
jgi:hypothetical protein